MEQQSTKSERSAPLRISVVTLWMLRVLVRGAVLERVMRRSNELPRNVRHSLALPELGHIKEEAALGPALEARLVVAERSRPTADTPIVRNVRALAKLFQLAPIERDILTLASVAAHDEGLQEVFAGPRREVHGLLAIALGYDRPSISRALRATGTLRATRMIEPRTPFPQGPPIKTSEWLAELLEDPEGRTSRMAGRLLVKAPATKLGMGDFAHMGDTVEVVTRVAVRACRNRTKGVNFLFFGAAGTGKTQLVRVVARAIGAELYMVADEDRDGEGLPSTARLGACGAAQRLLARMPGTLLVFDEAEDAFPFESSAYHGPTQRSTSEKSWTHRLLENNRVPTFWIANSVSQIDAATLRRFDVVVGFETPPLVVRQAMVEERLARTSVRSEWIRAVAADDRLKPSHVEQVAKVARLLGPRAPDVLERQLSKVLDASLDVTGSRRSSSHAASSPAKYDLAYVNASMDLDGLACALTARPKGTLCLHGPPGTGKTAYVRHLAERMGRPLRARKASDLLGMFVGETERNIARLFRGAEADRAVLFIDEADSLLRDRSLAMRSWEITQVNEMLVQVEQFEGVFVCATNLLDALDAASLRRFAIKIRFEPLRTEQAVALFAASVTKGVVEPSFVREELSRLEQLTPGDFAAVARRLQLVAGEVDADALLAGLKEEVALKRAKTRSVRGFRGGDA